MNRFSSIKYFIGVVAGKGGVGKSTFAAHLAGALALKGNRVGILDADIYGPSLQQILKEETAPQVLEGDFLSPAQAQGIHLMSYAYFGAVGGAVRAPVANGLIQKFLNEIAWGDLDYLIVDFPPGTGDIPLTLLQDIPFDGACVITMPQEVSLIDVKKSLNMLIRMSVPILGVLENMSYIDLPDGARISPFGSGGGEKLAQAYEAPYLGSFPIDSDLCAAGETGRLLFSFAPESPLIDHFNKLVEKIEEQLRLKGNKEKIIFSSHTRESFTIEWGNGTISHYKAKEVQASCPCARCKENGVKSADEDVLVKQISPIGRYGLKLTFSSGCSHGIYPFSLLKGF